MLSVRGGIMFLILPECAQMYWYPEAARAGACPLT